MTSAAGDLLALGSGLEWPDAEASATARALARPGSGRLAELAGWLAGTAGRAPARAPQRPVLVVLGELTTAVADLAASLDVRVRTVDLASLGDAGDALGAGRARADDEIESGADLVLLAAGPGGPPAAVVTSLLTATEPVALLPRGVAAVDTAAWIEAATALRDTRHRVADLRRDPAALLTALDDAALAHATGVVLGAVARRTPLVLDGATALAAGLVGYDLSARSARWWQAADTGGGRVPAAVVEHVRRVPLLGLGTDAGDGTAALLTLPLLRAAAAQGVGPDAEGPSDTTEGHP